MTGVYLDIKKAFDGVNFDFFSKLNKYGIRGQSLALLQDYLTNRKQKAKLLDDKKDHICRVKFNLFDKKVFSGEQFIINPRPAGPLDFPPPAGGGGV